MRKSIFAILSCIGLMISAGAAQASVEISTAATKNMNCSGGVCSPTAKKAVLNVNDLTNMLATGDVKITTGAGAVTITVVAPFSWTSTRRLTLDAKLNVSFRAATTVAGQGAVTIVTNDGGSSGDLLFFPGGKLNFWDTSSSLIINTKGFALVSSVKKLAVAVKANDSGAYAFANDYDAAPDGTYTHASVTNFRGVFEGLGHTISNLSINATTDAGLFKAVTSQGTVRDIDLVNANVVCTGDHFATALLTANNYGIVAHASATGSVQGIASGKRGLSWVGGLVGVNVGTISDSSATATASGTDNTAVGGLVGYSAADGSILGSHVDGTVSGGNMVLAGGLAGEAYAITDSYATASVTTGANALAGGLTGLGENVSGSFATGSVTAQKGSWAGALTGEGYTISDSYATGDVQGGDHVRVGGLDGVGGQIGSSYSTGRVTSGSRALAGGFIGYDNGAGDLSQTYWDLDTSGIADPSQGAGNIPNDPGVTGLTDTQIKTGLPAGFDPAIWGQKKSINNGYPYLLANPPPQ